MIRVLIVDDELLLRTCMQQILESEPDIQVPVTCDGPEAVAAVAVHRPDVVLLDLRMPGTDGLTVLEALRAAQDPPAVAVLTTFSADEDVARALGGGAAGFLLKDTAPDELIHSVRLIAAGGTVLSGPVARSVVQGYLAQGPARPGHGVQDTLTARELDVLALLADGLANAEIGRRLGLSAATAKDHVSAILGKLGVENRVQAAVFAHRAGLARTDPRPAA
ncbi:response regulator transcription factor [Streptomyces sp. NPDC001584]|uniref:response regulator transcription factor n=1 Tax=Streptomyces sp. NPDC001584 TaxID=3154521 RepID=UPI0033274289